MERLDCFQNHWQFPFGENRLIGQQGRPSPAPAGGSEVSPPRIDLLRMKDEMDVSEKVETEAEIDLMQESQFLLYRTYLNPDLAWRINQDFPVEWDMATPADPKPKWPKDKENLGKRNAFYQVMEQAIKNRDKMRYIKDKDGNVTIAPRRRGVSGIDDSLLIHFEGGKLAYLNGKGIEYKMGPKGYRSWAEVETELMLPLNERLLYYREGETPEDLERYKQFVMGLPYRMKKLIELRGSLLPKHETSGNKYLTALNSSAPTEAQCRAVEAKKGPVALPSAVAADERYPSKISITTGYEGTDNDYSIRAVLSPEGFLMVPKDPNQLYGEWEVPPDYYNSIKAQYEPPPPPGKWRKKAEAAPPAPPKKEKKKAKKARAR